MSVGFSTVSRNVKLSFLGVLGLGALVFAHDGDTYLEMDDARHFVGPIWTAGGDGPPELGFPADGVELMSWIPLNQLQASATSGSTVEGYVSPGGHEYAIIGVNTGTVFVRVTNPASPVVAGFISCAPAPNSLWRDLATYQNYCYGVTEASNAGGGIQVMNMANIDSNAVSLTTTVNGTGSTSTHTMFINKDSGFLYRCGGGSSLGVRIYNLTNPASPAFVVTALTNRYVHECQVVSYTSGPYAGKEILFCFSETSSGGGSAGINILDVTNKAAIVAMAPTLNYPNAAFSHQGWITPDKKYIYLNDELDERNLGYPTWTRVIDVTDLTKPYFLTFFGNGGNCVDHNEYVVGNLLFQSNYRSGLRVFDVSKPAQGKEFAYFDTWEADNLPNFNGLWDNYPYLPSGIVLGSDIEKGLFVWRVGARMLTFGYPSDEPALINPAGATVPVTINPSGGATIEAGSEKLSYNIGAGWQQSDLVPVSGNLYNAVFPSLPCGTQVQWYVSASTSSGLNVRNPNAAPTIFNTSVATTTQNTTFEDTMETNPGWVAGAPGDTAISGGWARVAPIFNAAQPGADCSDPGTFCWVTGQGTVGGAVGNNNVDGGITSLVSPTLDATAGPSPYIGYERWYSNNAASGTPNDSMQVQISNNNGSSWTTLETVSVSDGAWVRKEFSVASVIAPTNQMKIKFIASDTGTASIVEAAVDDVRLFFNVCQLLGDVTGNGVVDIDDLLAVIGAWGNCPGCPEDVTNNGIVDIDDLLFVINHWST